jgi:hypothetical protein
MSITSSSNSWSNSQPWIYFLSGALLPSIAYFFLWKYNQKGSNDDEKDDDTSEDDTETDSELFGVSNSGPSSKWNIADAPYKVRCLSYTGKMHQFGEFLLTLCQINHSEIILHELSDDTPCEYGTKYGQGKDCCSGGTCCCGVLQTSSKTMSGGFSRMGTDGLCQNCSQVSNTRRIGGSCHISIGT